MNSLSNLTPYHSSSRIGQKSELLMPEFAQEVVLGRRPDQGTDDLTGHRENLASWLASGLGDKPVLDRRRMLRYSLAGTLGAGLVLGEEEEAEAGFFAFVAVNVFASAIGWFVGRVLDDWFPDTPTGLGLRHVPAAKPGPDKFHNDWGPPWQIRNKEVHRQAFRVQGYNCQFGVDHYTRLVDVNPAEVVGQHRETTKIITRRGVEERVLDDSKWKGRSLIPMGHRRPFKRNSGSDHSALKTMEEEYAIDKRVLPFRKDRIRYVQDYTDVNGKVHRGMSFGIKRNPETGLEQQMLYAEFNG